MENDVPNIKLPNLRSPEFQEKLRQDLEAKTAKLMVKHDERVAEMEAADQAMTAKIAAKAAERKVDE